MSVHESPTPSLRRTLSQFLRLLRLLRGYWPLLLRGLAVGVGSAAIGLITPYITKVLIDRAYPARDVAFMNVLIGGLLVIAIVTVLLGATRAYFTAYITGKFSAETMLLFLNHIQHLRARFFDQHRVGEITSRVQDVRVALGTVSRVADTVVLNGVYLVFVPPLLFVLQWKLTIVLALTLPITLGLPIVSGRLLQRRWRQAAEANAELEAYQVEVLSNIRSLKTLAAERSVFLTARALGQSAASTQVSANAYSQVFAALSGIAGVGSTVAITWWAWLLIMHGEMSLGGYFAFSAYIAFLYGPLSQITNLIVDFQQSAVSFDRMFEYLDEETEQRPQDVYLPPTPRNEVLAGGLVFENVSFGYEDGRPVIRNFSASFPEGKITAVVGASGAGKSSLLRLLCRMENPVEGHIRIGDRYLREIPVQELRPQFGVVWQEFSLMRGTIWDNLTFGAGDISENDVHVATRISRLDMLVADLPMGYQTSVSEWGASLSCGQRQRLAIARAIVRNPQYLLLDEATSSIDVATELEIISDLMAHFKKATIVFVTHRMSTAALADVICVLEKGTLVDIGSPDALAERCSTYGTMLADSDKIPSGRSRKQISIVG